MPPDPPRMSCYAAELPSATMIYSSQFILVATLTLGPLHFWIASYGPDKISIILYTEYKWHVGNENEIYAKFKCQYSVQWVLCFEVSIFARTVFTNISPTRLLQILFLFISH